jgi:hypothetical protein
LVLAGDGDMLVRSLHQLHLERTSVDVRSLCHGFSLKNDFLQHLLMLERGGGMLVHSLHQLQLGQAFLDACSCWHRSLSWRLVQR